MDDFAIFHRDKQFLWQVKEAIEEYLQGLHLCLHGNKCLIFQTEKGVPFLGLVVFPHHRRLKRENVIKFKRRLKRFQRLYKQGIIKWLHIHQSVQSWLGHAAHANTMRLRKLILEEVVF